VIGRDDKPQRVPRLVRVQPGEAVDLASSGCCRVLLVLTPIEGGSVEPHPMHDDSELTGHGHARSFAAGPLGHPHSPGLQRRPPRTPGQLARRGLRGVRRSDVVGIFPNEDAITRLVGTILLQTGWNVTILGLGRTTG
jgi:hypothetical protein